MTLPTYETHPLWRRYQEFFPEGMRCTATSTPREEYWRWRDLDVHLDRLEVPTSPVKVIVLHGAGAYGRVMAPAAVLAQRHGFETVSPDLPGYGLTRVPRKRMTYDLWIDCVCDLIAAERARDSRPIVLFGVSLGGLLAYQAAARAGSVVRAPAMPAGPGAGASSVPARGMQPGPRAGASSVQPAPGMQPGPRAGASSVQPARGMQPGPRAGGSGVIGLVATTLADPRERAVRRGFARTGWLGSGGLWLLDKLAPLTDGLPLPMAYMSKMHRISNRPELSALVKSDRLGGGSWVPARFLRTLMSTAPALEPEEFTVCPVLLAHPGVDRMTDIALSRRFFDRLAAPKRMVVLDGASHMPTEHPGVDQLEAAVLDFMQQVSPASRVADASEVSARENGRSPSTPDANQASALENGRARSSLPDANQASARNSRSRSGLAS